MISACYQRTDCRNNQVLANDMPVGLPWTPIEDLESNSDDKSNIQFQMTDQLKLKNRREFILRSEQSDEDLSDRKMAFNHNVSRNRSLIEDSKLLQLSGMKNSFIKDLNSKLSNRPFSPAQSQ